MTEYLTKEDLKNIADSFGDSRMAAMQQAAEQARDREVLHEIKADLGVVTEKVKSHSHALDGNGQEGMRTVVARMGTTLKIMNRVLFGVLGVVGAEGLALIIWFVTGKG